jgi:pyruvate/2-oxoglutarate dehydrogenase complex dihydrolipoamide acyltransferase (E2) component
MPKTGAEMEEGRILCWKKQLGERVATGDILLEIETDKATMDVESPAAGVLLRTLFPAGDSVPATNLIAVIGEGTESAEQIDGFIRSITHRGPAR